jgi:UDP-3-O-[3-hydroxymyristoyl] glucosamine N-acyltransferase
VGKNCMFGGQVGLAGHLNIADGVKIGAQSGVTKTVRKEDSVIMGSPAFDMGSWQRSIAVFKNLPKLSKEIFELEQKVEGLTQ